jgi:hypothetical protein
MPQNRVQKRRRRRVTLMLGDRIPAFSADIGPGGVCVEMADVFLPGSSVHGSLKLGREVFRFRGEVTWAHPGDRKRGVLSRFGIRFDAMGEGFWSRFLARFPSAAHA